MTLPYRDCALFVLPIPIYRAVKVGRVRAGEIIAQSTCELVVGPADQFQFVGGFVVSCRWGGGVLEWR